MPLVVNGWTLRYHPVFGERYRQLRAEARRLKEMLPSEEFRQHPRVKLAAQVRRLILEIVPADPDAPEFWLRGDLAAFRRAKGHGLPPRYRLFWVFSHRARTIIYLYLNDEATLRKEGAATDPYAVFARLVDRGEIGPDFESNLRAWEDAHRDHEPDSPGYKAHLANGAASCQPIPVSVYATGAKPGLEREGRRNVELCVELRPHHGNNLLNREAHDLEDASSTIYN